MVERELVHRKHGIALDLAGCMGQIRLYTKRPNEWPPRWKIGKGLSLVNGIEPTVTDEFLRLLNSEAGKMYYALSISPLDDHDFPQPWCSIILRRLLVEHRRHGDHFPSSGLSRSGQKECKFWFS